MATYAWDPLREMEGLRREINRAFETMGFGRGMMPFSQFSFLPGRAARAYPLINISEDENNLYVEALAPGLDTASLKISVVRNQLSITGEKMPAKADLPAEACHRTERAAGTFSRTVTLPIEVDAANVKAEYHNGLIAITLPKSEAAKPKTIQVNVG